MNNKNRHEDQSEVIFAMLFPIVNDEHCVFSITPCVERNRQNQECLSQIIPNIPSKVTLDLIFSSSNKESIQSMIDASISLSEFSDCDKCNSKACVSEQTVLKLKEVLFCPIFQFSDCGSKLSMEVEINLTITINGENFQLCSVIVHACDGKYHDSTGGHFVILYTLTGTFEKLLCMDNDDIYEFDGSALKHEFVTEHAFLVTYQKID